MPKGQRTDLQPMPLCACGCGRKVKRRRLTWATPECVPRSKRQANGQKGGKAHGDQWRRRHFQAAIDAAGPLVPTTVRVLMTKAYWMGFGAHATATWRGRKAAA